LAFWWLGFVLWNFDVMIYFNQYFFQTVKTQSILMINKLFYCHHWDLGFNPLVTDFFITPHHQ